MIARSVTTCLLSVLLSGGSAAAQQAAPPPAAELAEPNTEATPDQGLPSRTIESDGNSPDPLAAPLLTVDQEALFARSAWGQRTQQLLEDAGSQIAAENERIAQELSDEEARLTEQRKALAPAEFRQRAEAFDARATRIRRERAQVVQELNARGEASRNAFYQAALPIMGDVMQQRGAVAVLDRRTVFVSLDAIDVTDVLVVELDRALGAGPEELPRPADDSAQD